MLRTELPGKTARSRIKATLAVCRSSPATWLLPLIVFCTCVGVGVWLSVHAAGTIKACNERLPEGVAASAGHFPYKWLPGAVVGVVVLSLAASLLLFALLVSRRSHQLLLEALIPRDLVRGLQREHAALHMGPSTLQSESPAELLLGLLSGLLSGAPPDLRDVVLLRTLLLRCAPWYAPIDLAGLMRKANVDSEVARALMQQLGSGPAGGASMGWGQREATKQVRKELLASREEDHSLSDARCDTLRGALAAIMGAHGGGPGDPRFSRLNSMHSTQLHRPGGGMSRSEAPPEQPSNEHRDALDFILASRTGDLSCLGTEDPPHELQPETPQHGASSTTAAPQGLPGAPLTDACRKLQSPFTTASKPCGDRHAPADGSPAAPPQSLPLRPICTSAARSTAPQAAAQQQATPQHPLIFVTDSGMNFRSGAVSQQLDTMEFLDHSDRRSARFGLHAGRSARVKRFTSTLPAEAPISPRIRIAIGPIDSLGSPCAEVADAATAPPGPLIGRLFKRRSTEGQGQLPQHQSSQRAPSTPSHHVAVLLMSGLPMTSGNILEGLDIVAPACAHGGGGGAAGEPGGEAGGGPAARPHSLIRLPRCRPELQGLPSTLSDCALLEEAPGPPPELIDAVTCLLGRVDELRFDTWELCARTGGHALSALGYYLLTREGLAARFGMQPARLVRLLRALEAGYVAANPYHNATHAADVLRTLHVLLHGAGLTAHYLDPLGLLAAYFAAMVHDYGHYGLTTDFLVATSHPLALRYNDHSPLESHHASAVFTLLAERPELDVLSGLSREQRTAFRKQVVEMVLGTDMKQHFALLSQFITAHSVAAVVNGPSGGGGGAAPRPSDRVSSSGGPELIARGNSSVAYKLASVAARPASGSLPSAELRPSASALAPRPRDEQERGVTLQVFLKVADLGHLAAEEGVHRRWVAVLEEEFFRQGDRERELGLPISPLFDRAKQGVSKSQVVFFEFVVLPLVRALAEAFPGAQPLAACYEENYRAWAQAAAQQQQGEGGDDAV